MILEEALRAYEAPKVAEVLAKGDEILSDLLRETRSDLTDWYVAETERRIAERNAYRVAPVEIAGVVLSVGHFYTLTFRKDWHTTRTKVWRVARYIGRTRAPYGGADDLHFQRFGPQEIAFAGAYVKSEPQRHWRVPTPTRTISKAVETVAEIEGPPSVVAALEKAGIKPEAET